MMAAQLSEYWGGSDPPQVYRVIVFYVVSPIVMLVINLLGISRFGWVEAIGGGLKVVLVLVTTLALYIMAGKGECAELAAKIRLMRNRTQ